MVNEFIRNKSAILILLFILLFYNEPDGISQEYSFREYAVRDGLPQSQAGYLFQDSRGYLWISTRNGLSRFDGIEFINYFRQEGLPSNYVLQIFEDRFRDLWVLSYEGFSKYTGTGFKFFPPGIEFSKTKFHGPSTSTDSAGKNFVITRNSDLSRNRLILFQNGKYTDYSAHYPALDTLRINNILFDTSNSDLLLIDSLENLWAWKDEVLTKISRDKFVNLFYDRGEILLTNREGLVRYANRKLYRLELEQGQGRADALRLPDLSILYFDGTDKLQLRLPSNQGGVFLDSEGTLWSPSDRYLSRLLSTAFYSLKNELINLSTMWAICFDKRGTLWLGSLEGDLFQFDGQTFRKHGEYKKLFSSYVSFYKGSRLMSNGEMWLSINCGVIIWDGEKFSKLKSIPEEAQVCYIYEYPVNHNIILGTSIGVYTISENKVTHFPRFNDYDLGVVEGVVRDDSGFYWLSGHKGLMKFDLVKAIPVDDPVLPEAFTYTIEKDSRGGIWVSSDEGLFFKKKSENYFRHGLPPHLNKTANSVKIIDNSHLCVGRGGDICIIDLDRYYADDKDYYRIYDKTDGFQGGDCLDNGIMKSKDGSFWILTSDGVVRLDQGRLRKNKNPPLTMFTGLYFETDSLSWQPVRKNEFYFGPPEDITLGRDQNKVRITFTGISTRNPEKVTYIYKLENRETKWSLPVNRREIIYDNLPPGQYTLLLKGINADGVENIEPVSLKFRILPSIWETNLFMVLSTLIILAFTILMTRYFIKRGQKLREEKLKVRTELSKLQINAVLRELDPHFTFNAISSIGYLIMKERKEEAYSYLTRLSSLLRTILYDGSSICRSLADELEFVRNYCELQILRFEGKFSYHITLDEKVDNQREIPKLAVQIFVENAIKHGFSTSVQGGRIDIILTQQTGFLEIIVRDNGVGRSASMKMKSEGTGHGIRTVNRIFEIMNNYNESEATLEIKDITGDENLTGTEVILRIPDNYNFTLGS